jgi:hypothetical protein
MCLPELLRKMGGRSRPAAFLQRVNVTQQTSNAAQSLFTGIASQTGGANRFGIRHPELS